METITEEFQDFIANKLHSLELNGLGWVYEQKHRYFHTWKNHIEKMLFKGYVKGILTDDLVFAIVFHDIVYNPKSKTNEDESEQMFRDYFKKTGLELNTKRISEAILSTKNHIPIEGNLISKQLIDLDMDGILGNFSGQDMFHEFVQDEEKVFKEYQFVDYKIYKEERIKFLKSVGAAKHYIDFVENRKPNIAVYAGSFNPFHRGHYDILQKAEKIFDKVIIARGSNPDKEGIDIRPLPEKLNYHQQDSYSGLLTDYLNNLDYEVTLIRGLRNASDFEYEKTQSRFLKDLKPDIKIVNIMCDSKYEHISSSAIRNLEKYGDSTYKKYLI